MKKVLFLSSFGILVFMLSACSAISSVSDASIKPGDRVGSFTLSTADEKTAGFPHNYTCIENGGQLSCEASVGALVNISPSFYDNTGQGRIEELWSEMTYTMLINGQLVNLQSFGPIDVANPMVSSVRKWNIAVVTQEPGEIIVQHSIVFDGKPDDFTVIWTFIEPLK